jgi:hypothetical protein
VAIVLVVHDYGGARALPLPFGLVVAGLIAFLLGACGGGTSLASVAHIGKTAPTGGAAPTAASGGQPSLGQLYQEELALAGCMRGPGDPAFPIPKRVDNGHMDGIDQGHVDRTSRQYLSANRICGHLVPVSLDGPTEAQLQQMMGQLLQYSKCMRAGGLPNFPGPTMAQGGISFQFPEQLGIDPNSPHFQAAQKRCGPLAPAGLVPFP